jgi:anti-sigma B factor antagonist
VVQPEFSLTQEHLAGGPQVIAVEGEIDLFTAPALGEALTAAIDGGLRQIVVDLTATRFLDSTALGVLIAANKRLDEHEGRLTIVNVDESIAKTFEITGLDHVFTMVATRAEAVAAFDDSGAARS